MRRVSVLRWRPRSGSASGVSAPRAAMVTTGMRRVSRVRIEVRHGAVHCEVYGVGPRHACVRPISLRLALALRASGVPTEII